MCPDLFDINAYDYDLPKELIAQYPLEERTESRLMVLNRAARSIVDRKFKDIRDYLMPGDLLVLNSSKVFPARLFGTKHNGTRIEVLLMNEIEPGIWKAMVHPGKRLKEKQILVFSPRLSGEIGFPDEDGFREIAFSVDGDFWEELNQVGHIPLPPYIERLDVTEDKGRYQTVYAKHTGSIAAPTAGFHFSEDLIDDLKRDGIKIAELVLHVGIGTFRPVKTERIDQHKMHSEYCVIDQDLADLYRETRATGGRVIAVGTTSLRTMESFYKDGEIIAGSAWTDIFLHPGKKVQSIDALITNFHLPKSTLLMLVSAFAGYEMTREAYHRAVTEAYRFFSYGDAMFIY